MSKNVLRIDDDYLEKMGDFFSSDFGQTIHPHFKEMRFVDWLEQQYRVNFQRSVSHEYRRNLSSRITTINS
jgi:hypothetical protein